ncbi:MAG: UDP-N-acetylglucosamine--N-acetylmuramyl-(pentapeptide) pyrophosphoryl-undecaprenol N-acetylglucosamine transferase [Candidatus Eremiobacteraeota bacterium]|nr:UDP-N-acetylglucosamine--N-acetylmuramyl-(pentapeptide) pyrophosphoryl-undecaprenol N-acetylglucosamine transferase [Candidatus Eremiobacteraeota bacterium]
MRILFTGGGTGGHLYPALSLAKALCGAPADPGLCRPTSNGGPARLPSGDDRHAADKPPVMLFVGTGSGADVALLQHFEMPARSVASASLTRLSPSAAARALARNITGCLQALPIVARFAPDVVIATGGYAAFPTVAAAALLNARNPLSRRSGRRIRIVLLEPNATPGLANRVLGRFADEIWGAYEQARGPFAKRFVLTGTPVRPELYSLAPAPSARRALGLDGEKMTVLIFGGSQGARRLNAAVSAMVARRRLPRDWQILHLCGRRDYAWMLADRQTEGNDNRYLLLSYLDDMALAYAAADVAVTRAGASTVAELAVSGVPSILVPYPHAAENHQGKNAELFVRRGASRILPDAKLDADSLYWALTDTVVPEKLAPMAAAARSLAHPRALHDMVERLLAR